MSWTSYDRSRCVRCGVQICLIPFGDGLWVHRDDDVTWGYDSALCNDSGGGLRKDGVLLTAKPKKKHRGLAG